MSTSDPNENPANESIKGINEIRFQKPDETSISLLDQAREVQKQRHETLKKMFQHPKRSPEYEELRIQFSLLTHRLRDLNKRRKQ